MFIENCIIGEHATPAGVESKATNHAFYKQVTPPESEVICNRTMNSGLALPKRLREGAAGAGGLQRGTTHLLNSAQLNEAGAFFYRKIS